ncbi:MAG: hypothetical protein LBQ12_09710 [Deltaproteobacteria bacterium]|nr:hypothetical protein [Deltaproteobacteria bacterium]
MTQILFDVPGPRALPPVVIRFGRLGRLGLSVRAEPGRLCRRDSLCPAAVDRDLALRAADSGPSSQAGAQGQGQGQGQLDAREGRGGREDRPFRPGRRRGGAPPQMFFGREREMDCLMDPGGP